MKRTAFFLFLILSLFSNQAYAQPKTASEIVEEIPVQHDGRIKPFMTFANSAMLYVMGRTRYQGESAAHVVMQWIAHPEDWYGKPVLPVKYGPLQKEFGVMLVDGKISPEVVLNHDPFLEEVREISARKKNKERLSTLEKKKLELYEKAAFVRAIGEGLAPGWVAHPEEPKVAWLTFQTLVTDEGREILEHFYPKSAADDMIKATRELLAEYRVVEERPVSLLTAQNFAAAVDRLFQSRQIAIDRELIAKEVHYDRFHAFQKAWIFYLLSLLVGLLGAGFSRIKLAGRIFEAVSLILFLTAMAIHTYGFYLRCVIAGRPPVTNMYESMIWVSWGGALFALILSAVYKSPFLRHTACLVGGLCLILAQSFPVAFTPQISPLVPVLRSNFWLTVHVLTITLSYGVFLLAWGIGHAVAFLYAWAPQNRDRLRFLSQYLYRCLQVGVVLLAAGTVLGGVWANYSWGRFWGWDPKETWALIALLGYLAVLHGRFAGWLSFFGLAVGSAVAFLGVLMAWYGVNYVLGAGLHSYGFGSGGLGYVMTAVVVDLAVLGSFVYRYQTQKGKNGPAGPVQPVRKFSDI